MPWALPKSLDTPANQEIAGYLRRMNPSAHDDVSTELSLAIEGLPSVKTFCPDLHAYAYVAAHDAEGRIFAIACGQSAVGVRVGRDQLAAAVIDGADPAPEIGADWAWFRAFRADESSRISRSRLGRWCRRAYLMGHGAE